MADAASAPVASLVSTDDGFKIATWDTSGTATGTKVSFGRIIAFSLSWQAFGTWGSATLSFQGSNDGTNWVTIESLTTDGGEGEMQTGWRYYRIITTGGTNSDLTAIMCAQRH